VSVARKNSTPTITAADLIRSMDLPPRPALLMALQRELRREEPDIRKVAQLLGRDAAMAGQLLKTANSAYLNLRRRSDSVEDAIALIGMNHCGSIMEGLILRSILGNGHMLMARFWDVSEKRAQGMSHVAQQTGALPQDLAYSFGLFCDIGIPLLKASFPAYLETLSIANKMGGWRFVRLEEVRHGLTHAEVGAALAEHWGISSHIVQAIRHHHAPEILADSSAPALVKALMACNLVVEKAIEEFRGADVSLEWREGGKAATDLLGMSMEAVDGQCTRLQQVFAGTS
jgi:HD-like signal output (HDOD) protein